jgi:chaperonin GroEL
MAASQIIDNLERTCKSATANEDIRNIATISSNSDKAIGDSIAEAFSAVGLNGAVLAEALPGGTTSVRMVDGLELDGGYVTDSLLVNEENYQAVLEDCCILISDEEISNINECLSLFNELSSNNKKVLIIAKSVKQEALATLVANRRLGRLNAMAISIPTFRGRYDKKAWFYDLSLMCGTTIISSKRGEPLRNVKMADLGHAAKVVVGKYSTKILGNSRNEEAIKNRIEAYSADLNLKLEERIRKDIENRIASLGSKAAIISVGYSTEAELKEAGDRLDDALNAVKAAIEEGLVAGGGIALLRASDDIDLNSVDDKYLPAFKVVISACERPITQICINSDKNPKNIISKILKNKSKTFGYNAATGEFGDLLEMGVVDPKKVTRLALKNAASVALLLINTEAIVAQAPNVPYDWQPPPGWRPPDDGKIQPK